MFPVKKNVTLSLVNRNKCLMLLLRHDAIQKEWGFAYLVRCHRNPFLWKCSYSLAFFHDFPFQIEKCFRHRPVWNLMFKLQTDATCKLLKKKKKLQQNWSISFVLFVYVEQWKEKFFRETFLRKLDAKYFSFFLLYGKSNHVPQGMFMFYQCNIHVLFREK